MNGGSGRADAGALPARPGPLGSGTGVPLTGGVRRAEAGRTMCFRGCWSSRRNTSSVDGARKICLRGSYDSRRSTSSVRGSRRHQARSGTGQSPVGRMSRPISRILSSPGGEGRPSIWDAHRCAPRCNLPADIGRAARQRRPEGPLGLAPGGVYRATTVARRAGELLPHRFTLTRTPVIDRGRWRSALCGTVPHVAVGGR